MQRIVFIVISSLLFGLSALVAQNNAEQYELLFKTGTVVVPENVDKFIARDIPTEYEIVEDHYYRLIQFYHIPTLAERELMLASGITLLEYIPAKSYYASISLNADRELLRDFNIRSVVEVEQVFKMDPYILSREYPDWAMREQGKIDLFIHYYQDLESEYIINELGDLSVEILSIDDLSNHLLVRVPVSEIDNLISKPYILFVEPIYPEPEPENYSGRTLHRSNAIATEYFSGRHYDGTGVNIMLQDDGIIGPHIDYQGRIGVQYIGTNFGDHGDHVAGTIMGAGNLDPKGRGMAFGSTIYVYGAAPEYPGFEIIPQHYFDHGIRISSTSYSNGCNAGYTSLTRTMDIQVRTFPGLMHVFSAGNNGTSNCGYGAGSGWGNITGGHKVAKNVITVGNLDYKDALSGSSSRGPAHDGRIKPDVCAKGSNVYSTTNPNDYTTKSGTSMSCPGTSGTLAQLYHAYTELNGLNPPSDLLKGILLNTADDLGNSGPDFKFGWGRINALHAVRTLEEFRYELGLVEQDDVDTHEIEVPENVKQLKLMVYWNDYQASIGTNKALVNDLDIVLTTPSMEDFYPWVLDHTPDPQALNEPAIRAIDHMNNMEQVTIDNPEPGIYSLTIEGYEVPQGPQAYYLIYEFLEESATITYPIGGESFVPGETEVIRWDAFGETGGFKLEYTTDGGENWKIIAENVNASMRYYNWFVPAEIGGQAYISVSRNGIESVNTVPFSIMKLPENMFVDWSCDSSFRIHWDEVSGAMGYELSLLGEKYMDSVGYTTQNSFIIEGVDANTADWYSVKAIGPDNAKGRRVLAEVRNPGVFNCFAKDVAMEHVVLTEFGYFQDCMDLAEVPVTIEVRNNGYESISDIEIGYQINDGDVIIESYNETMDANELLSYTFEQMIDLTIAGTYNIMAWVIYDEDMNPENDTLYTSIEVMAGTLLSAPFIQTFDSFENCLSWPTCENVVCDLAEGWFNPTNIVVDDIDWRTYSGNTATPNTGPSGDHTTGTGKYLYLEPSIVCFNKGAQLISPCIDLTDAYVPALNFWYHAFGPDIGSLHVDLISDLDVTENIMIPIFGNKGDQWNEVTVDLSEYVGKIIVLIFRGYTANGQLGDLAIDDVSVFEATGLDNNDISSDFKVDVYPNPGKGVFSIYVPEVPEDKLEITITDLFGKIVYSEYVSEQTGTYSTELDLTGFSGGLYFVSVTSGSQRSNLKLVVQ